MAPEDAAAVVNFLSRGGKVHKIQGAIPVTEPEVLDFLASRGVRVQYLPGTSKAFGLGQKRFKLPELIGLANKHRHSEQLAPFALRIFVRVPALRKQ
jgi:hypothetical protein